MKESRKRHLSIFLDEAGNFDFSKNGTRYFQVGAITKERPFHACKALNELKYDLVEKGLDIEYFHAAEDQQATRNEVFAIIRENLDGVRFDSIYLDKQASGHESKHDHAFYVEMFHHDSKSNFDLQIADYFNWAAFRYLRDGDDRSYKLIAPVVRPALEFTYPAEGDARL